MIAYLVGVFKWEFYIWAYAVHLGTVALCGVEEGELAVLSVACGCLCLLCCLHLFEASEHATLSRKECGVGILEVGDLVLQILAGVEIGYVGAELCFAGGDGGAAGQLFEDILSELERHCGVGRKQLLHDVCRECAVVADVKRFGSADELQPNGLAIGIALANGKGVRAGVEILHCRYKVNNCVVLSVETHVVLLSDV